MATNRNLRAVLLLCIALLFNTCGEKLFIEPKGIERPECILSSLEFFWSDCEEPSESYDNGKIVLEYDPGGRLINWKNNWEADIYEASFHYDEDGNVIRIEESENQEAFGGYNLTWTGNIYEIQRYSIVEGEDRPSLWKRIVELDDESQVIKIEYYSRHNEEWHTYSYANIFWESGNPVKIDHYHEASSKSLKSDEQRTRRSVIRALAENQSLARHNPGHPLTEDKNGFYLSYSREYEYDEGHNPFFGLPLWLTEPEDPLFYSKNTLTQVTFTNYEQNEASYKYAEHLWEYNFQQFPVSMVQKFLDRSNECTDLLGLLFSYENCD